MTTTSCDEKTGQCHLTSPLASSTEQLNNLPEITVIYVGDPMCSWCWGIAPELTILQQYTQAKPIDYQIILGGLRQRASEEWDERFKRFLKHHWQSVKNQTGQPFNQAFFERTNFSYLTEPSCRAVITLRTLLATKPNSAKNVQQFFTDLQKAFFVDNQDPTQLSTFTQLIKPFAIEEHSFISAFNSQAIKQATQTDFKLAQQLGVNGFPSVLLWYKKQPWLLASGYAKASEIIKAIEKIQQSH